MAFPQFQGTPSGGSFSSSGTGLALTMPSGITAGERLVCLVSMDWINTDTGVDVTVSSGTGWVRRELTLADSNLIGAIFEKLSAAGDSSDDLTLAVSGIAGSAELGTYTIFRISGHDSSAALEFSDQDFNAADAGPSTDMRPPTLTPSWGSADTLWIWAGLFDNGTRTLSSYPTNYSANQNFNAGAASSATVGIAIASRELAASSETIGAGVLSTAEQWISYAIAIKPTGASGSSGTINATGEVVDVNITGEAPVNATVNITTVDTQVSITGSAGSASDNIRLQPSLYLERGGYAASLTADRWIVFTSDLSAVEDTGTALSINSTGQPTIDITGSASYVVGDQVPLFITVYDEGSNPEDRTVRTFFGWVEAIAQA